MERWGRGWEQCAILAAILAINVFLKLPNLGHPALKPMDESFHAVVARNLLYDPFKPTLVRDVYEPYDPTDWLSNHVWLHKPVLPLWIIAISFKLMGVSALALRVPSLILSTLAVALTFLIARRVYGIVAAIVASGIQAIIPAIGMIVQGYVFSDAIDVNLLFWTELSLFLMLQKNRKWVWLSGAAAGAAFLSKTFPALFVLGPLMLVGAMRAGFVRSSDAGATERRNEGFGFTLLGWAIAFLVIVVPWNIYCAARFQTEFTAEYGLILTHLSADVENWASPWDRLWFQHLPGAMLLFWTTSLVGSVVLTFRAIQLRKWEWLFAPVWIVAVVIPFTLATSKTPTATLIAWPAFAMGAGFLIGRACRGYVVELAATITVLIAANFFTGKFISIGWGMTQPFEIMRQAQWIAWHVVAGLCVATLALLRDVRLTRGRAAFVAIVLALLAVPTGRTVLLARSVAKVPQLPDVVSRVRDAARQLPPNAVLFIPSRESRRRNEIMFYLDRSAYVLPDDPKEAAQSFKDARDSGGEVWVLDPSAGRGGEPMLRAVK